MLDPGTMPEWLGAAVVGAVLAAIGYVAKLLFELGRALMTARRKSRARLVRLRSLLASTRVAFLIQNDLARKLSDMLRDNHGAGLHQEEGFEREFEAAFDTFTPKEAELHRLIRGYTERALRPANQAISDWVRSDTVYKAKAGRRGWAGDFAANLEVLEIHLLLWHAKYESWIPGQPKHALVYLADEQQHGVGFPHGIDALLDKALGAEPTVSRQGG